MNQNNLDKLKEILQKQEKIELKIDKDRVDQLYCQLEQQLGVTGEVVNTTPEPLKKLITERNLLIDLNDLETLEKFLLDNDHNLV